MFVIRVALCCYELEYISTTTSDLEMYSVSGGVRSRNTDPQIPPQSTDDSFKRRQLEKVFRSRMFLSHREGNVLLWVNISQRHFQTSVYTQCQWTRKTQKRRFSLFSAMTFFQRRQLENIFRSWNCY